MWRKGPALCSIPESPVSREEDPGLVFGQSRKEIEDFWMAGSCQAGAAKRKREVTLSLLLALKLRTDTAQGSPLLLQRLRGGDAA